MSLKITNQISIPLAEIQFQAIRAQGAGGQNVNKVSSAVHLRFEIDASSLPDTYKDRLRKLSDQRITELIPDLIPTPPGVNGADVALRCPVAASFRQLGLCHPGFQDFGY